MEKRFGLQTIEKTPFADPAAQKFFTSWCTVNDSILPQFISREEWKKRGQDILEKEHEGRQKLFLPHDLHLSEMMDVIRIVDHHTLVRKPEKQDQRADKIQDLGATFEKAGMYLAEYLPHFQEADQNAQAIAAELAKEFYAYGVDLQHKDQPAEMGAEQATLSDEDKTQLDEWFLGKDVYQRRMARLGENPDPADVEKTRIKLLQIYFKVLAREGHQGEGKKPWETAIGPMQQVQNRTTRGITKAIETPEREMKSAVFTRGIEKLVTEMKTLRTNEVGWKKLINDFLKKVGFDEVFEQEKLYETLGIEAMKQELEAVRATEDIAQISAKELEIAQKIQKAVSSFPYKSGANYPSKMVETQFINCLGSSMLGGGLLDELGIQYLHADLPKHSATVLITRDGKGYWQDFTPGAENLRGNYTELTEDILKNNTSILEKNITDSGVSLVFNEFNPYPRIQGELRVTLFRPEIGLQCQVLNNLGNTLSDLGRKEEAIEAYNQAMSFDPRYAYPYHGLGNTLSDLGRKEEAIEVYKKAIDLDPQFAYPYHGIGNVLTDLGTPYEAIEAYKKAIDLDPQFAYPYYGVGKNLRRLGKYEEAIDAYKQALRVDPQFTSLFYDLGLLYTDMGQTADAVKMLQRYIEIVGNPNDQWVKKAEQMIRELEA